MLPLPGTMATAKQFCWIWDACERLRVLFDPGTTKSTFHSIKISPLLLTFLMIGVGKVFLSVLLLLDTDTENS
jgi:hypothetical protein